MKRRCQFECVAIMAVCYLLCSTYSSAAEETATANEIKDRETTVPAASGAMDKRLTTNHAALVAYTMGGNLVRQGRTRDALQYYTTAVTVDPGFVEAMNDAALIYKMERDFEAGKNLLQRAILIQPEMSDLHHNLGEVFQAQGLEQLSLNELDAGTATIQEAIKSYGKAIDVAEKQGILATRAASYFRLGEICYYANNDVVGARQYWEQVLRLHSPTPDPSEKPENFWRLTRTRVDLVTWQQWAGQYLNQLTALSTQVDLRSTNETRPERHTAPGVGSPSSGNSDKMPEKRGAYFGAWNRFNR